MNPRELLERAMTLINQDLEHISSKVKDGKLSHDNAQDLARYSTALLSIVKDNDEQSEKSKESVHKMPQDKLEELARKYLGEKGV